MGFLGLRKSVHDVIRGGFQMHLGGPMWILKMWIRWSNRQILNPKGDPFYINILINWLTIPRENNFLPLITTVLRI